MTHPTCLIGNDVVDLSTSYARTRIDNQAFLQRVFGIAERNRIRLDTNPTRALWRLWAAKESAYKIAVKINPGTPFTQSQFVVKELGDSVQVHHGNLKIFVKWSDRSPAFIHCLAMWPNDFSSRVVMQVQSTVDHHHSFTAAELQSVYSAQSRQARSLAKELFKQHFNHAPVQIIRPVLGQGKFGPPTVDGFEISLSHDGPYVAAAIMRRAAECPFGAS